MCLGDDAARPARHLQRGAADEGEEEDAFRGHAFEDQVRYAVREGVGLAGAGAGDDEEGVAMFEGEVERGGDYLLVDDFVGQGGTIANLKGFIEARGGTAVGCTTLTGKPWSAKLTPSADTLRKLREKHGGELESWWEDTFGYGFGFLTESEARYLARADSVELIRNRILAARQAHDD